MRFAHSFLDEIRARVPISEVIGAYVAWHRGKTNAARGDYWACCPFHGEKTPSFHCENAKGRYYCFGCNVSGDHFTFLVEHAGMSFRDAVEELARRAGLSMPAPDPRQSEREAKRKSLHDVMALAARFFQEQLYVPKGAQALSYLRSRGLPPAILKEFGIGYAPDSRHALQKFLQARAISPELAQAAGLVVHGEDVAEPYDRFRDRIIFPIADARGRIIAFGGRALRADAKAKYLNSPETPLFRKSETLYNLSRAGEAARKKQQIIVAEGYFDVIALHMAGFANAVAPLGTALSETQLAQLWRHDKEPLLCFDGDSAGQAAAGRAADLALQMLKPGHSLRFALLPEGSDPDEILRQQGGAALAAALAQTMPLADLIWLREADSGSFDTPERRAELENRMRALVASIRDESVRRYYGQEFARRLEELFGTVHQPLPRKGGRMRRDRPEPSLQRKVGNSASLLNSAIVRGSSIPLREAILLASAIHHPAVLQVMFEDFAGVMLTNRQARRLHGAILDILAEGGASSNEGITAAAIDQRLREKGLGQLIDQVDQIVTRNRVWQAKEQAAFEDALEGFRQALRLHWRVNALQAELRAAEAELVAEYTEENLFRLTELHKEITREEGLEALIEGFGMASGRPAGH